MCGIVGIVGRKSDALDVLIKGLKTLEYRGYDSAGVAYVINNKIKIVKEKGKIIELEKKLNFEDKSKIGIAHTRWATHGAPETRNSHPHKCGKITIVHNGIIENYIELKEMLSNEGYKFESDTDTEVGCALLDYYYKNEKEMLKAINRFRENVRGSYALGIINDDELDTVYALRKDSPLILAVSDEASFIASDVPAILKYTNKYMILDEGEIAVLKDEIKVLNKDFKEIKKEILIFEGELNAAMKNGYEHFMLKEIHEQPEILEKTFNAFNDFNVDMSIYKRIEIVACGSAYHTGLVGKALIEKFCDIPVEVCIASEYRYAKHFYDKSTLVVIISQSGETADSVAVLRKVNDDGIDTLAIVNVVGSSIAREAKYVLYTKAGPEIAVATTKAYSAQVLSLACIAMKISKQEINIKKIVSEIKKLLESDYSKIANVLAEHEHIFFLGRGVDYALAMEGSLKLKEISYIHSEAYAAGELKHGTISLVTEGTPVIAVVTDKVLAEKTISNIKEVKARGAYVVVVTTESLKDEGDYFDERIVIPDLNELSNPLLTIIPLQLLSYEVAKKRGCDIDKPRNLAKSVTVE